MKMYLRGSQKCSDIVFQQNEIIIKDGSLNTVYTEDSTTIRGHQTILGMAKCCFQQVSCKPSTHHYILMSLS